MSLSFLINKISILQSLTKRNRPMKFKEHIVTSILLFTAIMLILMMFTVFYLLKSTHETTLKLRSQELASIIAQDHVVKRAVQRANNISGVSINPYIESLRAETEVTFIVVVNKTGIRLSHPDPEKVGQEFVGTDLLPVLTHGIKASTFAKGSSGPAFRSFAPVIINGKVSGAVCVGILNEQVGPLFIKRHSQLLIVMLLVPLIGSILTITLLAKLKSTMQNLEPELVVNMLLEHDRIFNAIRDPMLSVDQGLRITNINDIATKIFAMGSMSKNDFIGQSLGRFSSSLGQIIKSGIGKMFSGHIKLGKLDYRVCIYPLHYNQDVPMTGYVIIFLSDLRLNELKKELIYYKNYAELLRSKTHEYSNKLNVLSGMLQLHHYDDAVEFIDRESCGDQKIIGNIVHSIQNSTVASILLSKYNKAVEMGVKYQLDDDNVLQDYSKSTSEHLATMLANLIDNAIRAASQNKHNVPPEVHIYISDRSQHIIIEVQDTGVGVDPLVGESILDFGVSSKEEQEQTGVGLFLVNELITQLNGSIDWERTENNTTVFSIYLDKDEIKQYEK